MKKYIVSSYIPGSLVDEKVLKTLETFAKKNKTELIIPLTKPNHKSEDGLIDSRVVDYVTIDEISLSKKLLVSSTAVNVNSLDPLSGMQAIACARGNLVVAAPRHRFMSVARSLKHNKHPRGIWCTGTVSQKHYKSSKAGDKVENIHTLGALYIEVNDDETFRIHQLEYKNGSICFMTKKYSGNKVTNAKIKAVSMGDFHPPFVDPDVIEETKKMLKLLKPEKVFWHDSFDACSISHHVEGKYLTKALINESYGSLEEELQDTADKMNYVIESCPKSLHVVVRSNHDEHLDKYLDEFRFKDDAHNLLLALDLAKKNIEFSRGISKQNALEFDLKQRGLHPKVKFLKRQDKMEVCGIEMSNHGDYGANGSRGSSKQHGLSFTGDIVTGHAHTPEIGPYGNYVNGTCTYLSLPYTNDSGTSGWMNTHTIVYENGGRSHYHIISV